MNIKLTNNDIINIKSFINDVFDYNTELYLELENYDYILDINSPNGNGEYIIKLINDNDEIINTLKFDVMNYSKDIDKKEIFNVIIKILEKIR